MNWDAIGAIGEILGAIAVLVTLGYLALQVRHAREQMSRGVRGARSEALRQLLALNVTLPDLRMAMDKLDDRLGVDPSPWTAFVLEHGGTRDEASLLYLGEWYRWSLVEQTLANAEDLAMAERAQAERFYRGIYGGNGVSAHWYRMVARPALNAETVRYVDNLLAQQR